MGRASTSEEATAARRAADLPALRQVSLPDGLYRTPDHQYYWNGEYVGMGVTGALGIIDKPALAMWRGKEVARAAFRNWETVTAMVEAGGEDAAVKWLNELPGYVRDTAGSLGTRVHDIAERLSMGEELRAITEEEEPYVGGIEHFLDKYRPRFVAREFGVISLTHGYGGTGDAICEIDGLSWLIDYKTSTGIYKETALQLAAYGAADFIGFPNDPTPYALPRIDRYGVLHIRPDKYVEGARLFEYQVGPDEVAAFLASLELSTWAKTAKPVGAQVSTSWVQKR